MMLQGILFLAGVGLLYLGGEWCVDGSSQIAKRFHIRPFVIGAVIVGFGTSAPEAFVSLTAQLKASAGISFGNIVGSSIANIGLILGVACLIHDIKIDKGVLKIEYPFLLFSTLILIALAYRGDLEIIHAVIFLILFGIFLIWSLYSRTAIGILSAAEPSVLVQAVANNDVKVLTGVSGVGKKTAERILIELKGKVEMADASTPVGDMQHQAMEALVSIGFSKQQARDAVQNLSAEVGTVEEAVRAVLQDQRV